MITIISPHLDDAVLSLGDFLARNEVPVSVVTVLAGIPGFLPLTKYDFDCGFSSGAEAMGRRRVEDKDALAFLRCEAHHLDFLDMQYGIEQNPEQIKAALKPHLDMAFGPVYVPLGLVHPDHELVARCAMEMLLPQEGREIFVYEDAPSRVLYPESVREAILLLGGRGWVVSDAIYVPQELDLMRRKMQAIHHYRSQLWSLDLASSLAPERIHPVVPSRVLEEIPS